MSETSSAFGLSQRQLPSNIQAEQSLLGSVLAVNSSFDRCGGLLPEHFADPVHAQIFGAIARRVEAGKLVDAVTLKAAFENTGLLDDVGGTPYLAQLLSAMVSPLNVPEYAAVIRDCWVRRQLIEVHSAAIEEAFASIETEGVDQIEATVDRLAEISEEAASGSSRRSATTIGEAVRQAEERAQAIYRGEAIPGLSTGIAGLDKLMGGGFHPATMTYLSGLGEVGKTTLALQIAENIAKGEMVRWIACGSQGPCPCVMFFSFDMTAMQIGTRSAARLGGVPASAIRNGELSDGVVLGLMKAQAAADNLPLEIDDGEPPSLGRVVSTIRRIARKRPIALTIIDNLSKIIGEGKMGDQLFPAFLNATNTLKKMANRTGIPTMLLVHLPQSVAKRDNPKPKRGDLPYGIHLHADTALGLWRPELSLPSAPPDRGKLGEEMHQKLTNEYYARKNALKNVAEIVPLKLREDEGGGDVRLKFDAAFGGFVDPNTVATDQHWEGDVNA